MTGELKLKVAEAIQDDVNKGIVRIDSSFMYELGIRAGDIVEIKGERTTVGIADRAYPGDIGLNIIRMDGLIRRNAKAGIGETVSVKKASVVEAKKVVIAPQRKDISIRGDPRVFKMGLLGRAVIKGDIVSLGGSRRRKQSTQANPMFDEDIFSMMPEGLMGFGLGDLKFIVVDATPKQAVMITEQTEVQFNPQATEVAEEGKALEVTYEDIGGLQDEIRKIREMVELPLKHPEVFEALGIEPPKGILLYGPPGTGKTLLAKAVANETSANFLLINGPEIMSKYYGQSEENLRKKFEEAEKNAPSIIFIDEIDAIASKREESKGEVERRVVAQMLALMDGLKSRGKVIVIGATNIPNELDPALRRPGRFDRELEIGVPDKEGRLNILKIHSRNMPIDDDPKTIDPNIDVKKIEAGLAKMLEAVKTSEIVHLAKDINKEGKQFSQQMVAKLETYLKQLSKENLDQNSEILASKCRRRIAESIASTVQPGKSEEAKEIITSKLKDKRNEIKTIILVSIRELMLDDLAEVTHGFVGADLSALAKEAAMDLLREIYPDLKLEEDKPISKEQLEKLKVKKRNFVEALKVVRPSALREVLIEVPNVSWRDIGGLDTVRQELLEAVEWPLKQPIVFSRMGIKPPKGILLYGPPGTGKTLLAKAVAHESKANFILVKGPELLSKWVGESEKAVRKIFEKARQASPAIIFFDELDSLAARRGGDTSDGHTSDKVVNQLLTEMDGVVDLHNIVILGATNRPDMIDTALLRPGRFDRIILVPSPDEASRLEILKIHTKNMPISKDVDLKEIARLTEGYVGADIEAICREAAMLALRKDIKAEKIGKTFFDDAMQKVSPSVTKDVADAYKELQSQFRAARGKEMKETKPVYYG
ncbi:MAG: CDC48 family AAA ATPase [Nanoarchaeota archaeon]|nr:CDC48 family AAA ATPase [Nanoarchaeota archaeon]